MPEDGLGLFRLLLCGSHCVVLWFLLLLIADLPMAITASVVLVFVVGEHFAKQIEILPHWLIDTFLVLRYPTLLPMRVAGGHIELLHIGAIRRSCHIMLVWVVGAVVLILYSH